MSVNFHKKLKDEFDRYDRLQRDTDVTDSLTYQTGTKSVQLRQMIANQYLNVNREEGTFSD